MRSRIAGLAALAVLAGLLAGPGSAGQDSGSYEVTAVPLGSPYGVVPGAYCEEGVEGIHMSSKLLVAPAAGLLDVTLADHSGDWDIGLYDDDTDEWIGYGGYNSPTYSGDGERATARVAAGQDVRVVVCNYLSEQSTVTVNYRFTRGLVPMRTAPSKGFRHLAAGELPDLREKVPVNVVLVGYDRQGLPAKELLAQLPQVSRPIERMPNFYGYHKPVGITYTYDYRITRTDASWNDRFFRYLRSIAHEAPLTRAQITYNEQRKAIRRVARNHEIFAPDVERYLATKAPAGVDTRRHTVFLVNWWGRKDFVDHVYVKPGEPNTDTGEDLGAELSVYRLVAWGGSAFDDPETGLGSPRRVWFHDLSAGPDAWTSGEIVDVEDIDGDGRDDRRLPAAWEYTEDGYREPEDLPADLGDLVRYVAVNLLFTPSPLYPVALTPPALPQSIDIDLNRYEHDAVARPISDLLNPGEISRNVSRLLRHEKVTADDQTLDTRRPGHVACYAQLLTAYQGAWGPGCDRSDRYLSFSNPYISEMSDRSRFLDDPGVDYEVPVFLYSLTDGTSPADACFAYADDNQRDGTQSQVVAFMPAWCRRSVGATDLTIHELGHHFALSHPHDGYDYETGVDYGAWREHLFAGLGDEVSSVMSYMWINNEFSQFDYDNLDRFAAAGNVAAAQSVAAVVLRSPRAGAARTALRTADEHLGRTSRLFAGHRYQDAAQAARQAYAAVRAAARTAGVTVAGSDAGWRIDETGMHVPMPRERGYAAVDRVEIGPDGHGHFSRLVDKTLTPFGPVDRSAPLAGWEERT